jgi:hypothetical protein
VYVEVADEPARSADHNPSATAGGVILVVSFDKIEEVAVPVVHFDDAPAARQRPWRSRAPWPSARLRYQLNLDVDLGDICFRAVEKLRA